MRPAAPVAGNPPSGEEEGEAKQKAPFLSFHEGSLASGILSGPIIICSQERCCRRHGEAEPVNRAGEDRGTIEDILSEPKRRCFWHGGNHTKMAVRAGGGDAGTLWRSGNRR